MSITGKAIDIPPPKQGKVEVVSIVETMIVEALRARSARVDPDHQSVDRITGKQAGSEQLEESNARKTVTRATRALQKRMVVALKDPKPGVEREEGKDVGYGHDQTDQDHDNDPEDEALVAQYVRSSLDIALPKIKKEISTGQATGNEPALAYGDMDRGIVFSTTTPSATSHSKVLPPAGLPPVVQEELQTILSNYLTWDKKLYADLRLDPESIRLVEIRPGSGQIEVDLIKKSLDEARNAYEALSYTWGSPTPKETIMVNGVKVQINEWLFGALSSLRLPNAKRCLWVDAICINQADIAERSIEVQKMGDIYRLAKTVVVFHGWPSTTTPAGSLLTALFKFFSRSVNNGVSDTESSQANIDVEDPFRSCGLDRSIVCQGFIDFCFRPWWGRVWTMQEFYLATEEPVWYWGNTGVSNTVLKRDMPLLMTASWELYGGKDILPWISRRLEGRQETPDQFSAEIRRIFDMIGRRHKTHGFDIPSRLYRSLSAQATDPRDLVYGLREIFDPVFRRVFVPDYFMQLELLYACLAVFLIQFEGWGDMLWWYPHRFQGNGLPSWLPDFTKRVVPAVTEILPGDHLSESHVQLKLAVLNHALHVEGYRLDNVEAFALIGNATELDVLRELWRFEATFNRSRLYSIHVSTEEELENLEFNRFLAICRSGTSQDNSSIYHPVASLLDWTTKSNTGLPSTLPECLPYWDILMWHAFRIGSKAVSEQFDEDDRNRPGILQDIFSSNLSNAFRKIIAADFIADCVFDWDPLEYVLEYFASMLLWSDGNSPYWQSMAERKLSERDQWDKELATIVSSFLASLQATSPESVGDLSRFHALCSLVLLDASEHTIFIHILAQLRSAGEELHRLSLDWRVQAQVDDLKTKDETVAARVRHETAVKAHFNGRSLFWTRQGFQGLTAPGVEPCEGADVLLLNGLSFPMVAKDFNEEQGNGRLVGCAIVRGVDMRTWKGKAEAPQVPERVELGEKSLFKFT
jgi:hypothetical protein